MDSRLRNRTKCRRWRHQCCTIRADTHTLHSNSTAHVRVKIGFECCRVQRRGGDTYRVRTAVAGRAARACRLRAVASLPVRQTDLGNRRTNIPNAVGTSHTRGVQGARHAGAAVANRAFRAHRLHTIRLTFFATASAYRASDGIGSGGTGDRDHGCSRRAAGARRTRCRLTASERAGDSTTARAPRTGAVVGRRRSIRAGITGDHERLAGIRARIACAPSISNETAPNGRRSRTGRTGGAVSPAAERVRAHSARHGRLGRQRTDLRPLQSADPTAQQPNKHTVPAEQVVQAVALAKA
jgi:hypothetical protein